MQIWPNCAVGDELAWARAGANLMMHSTDVTLVVQSLQQELKELRALLGDSGTPADLGQADRV